MLVKYFKDGQMPTLSNTNKINATGSGNALLPTDMSVIKESIKLETKLIHPDAKLPFRKRTTDAGWDLYSVEDVIIGPQITKNIHTGICISAPEGYYYTIEGRSSMFMRGITPNRGIIDATYCGEVIVSLVNKSNEEYKITVGDRIAQIILHRCYDANFFVVDEFSSDYNKRGTAGFGSSGK
jgi:dUTP pyrophosphatase